MKIAVVGTGVSGLVAAHLLNRDHDVTVFEAGEWVGGHAHTVDVELDGEHHAVDTGFIVYNERTYPLFTQLLDRLGVASQETDMSFSVRCDRTGLEWASRSVNAIFAQRRNLFRPGFRRMLGEVERFHAQGRRLIETGDEKLTLRDYVLAAGHSREFVDHFLVPMGAAIWSAPPEAFLDSPAASFARFFENHGLLERRSPIRWRCVRGGSRRYVESLAAPFRDQVRLRCPVRAVRRRRRRVELWTAGGPECFDRVVLAVHGDQALALLSDASDAERAILGSIRYQPNEVVLHTDSSLMPRSRRAWASWNYHVPAEPRSRVAVSYHMNRLQRIRARQELIVTLNETQAIDPGRILKRFVYHHPVFDARALAAQKLHAKLDGARGTHFCGAYWGYGFHEDGVRSALEVCRRLGLDT